MSIVDVAGSTVFGFAFCSLCCIGLGAIAVYGRQETDDEWCKDYANVKALGRHFADIGFTGKELQGYYEKPWKWTAEWNEFNSPADA